MSRRKSKSSRRDDDKTVTVNVLGGKMTYEKDKLKWLQLTYHVLRIIFLVVSFFVPLMIIDYLTFRWFSTLIGRVLNINFNWLPYYPPGSSRTDNRGPGGGEGGVTDTIKGWLYFAVFVIVVVFLAMWWYEPEIRVLLGNKKGTYSDLSQGMFDYLTSNSAEKVRTWLKTSGTDFIKAKTETMKTEVSKSSKALSGILGSIIPIEPEKRKEYVVQMEQKIDQVQKETEKDVQNVERNTAIVEAKERVQSNIEKLNTKYLREMDDETKKTLEKDILAVENTSEILAYLDEQLQQNLKTSREKLTSMDKKKKGIVKKLEVNVNTTRKAKQEEMKREGKQKRLKKFNLKRFQNATAPTSEQNQNLLQDVNAITQNKRELDVLWVERQALVRLEQDAMDISNRSFGNIVKYIEGAKLRKVDMGA